MAQRGLKGTQLRKVSSPGKVFKELQVTSGLTDWDTASPEDLQEAVQRLAATVNALLAKLDADTGVSDTNYQNTLKP